ncbi:MAG: sugar ABC transporter ATP-binding protein [Bifidobacteriaceae bacterium]|jgi:simple sugar transport system ATP-binding protein/ribose transport system ATP-binding protein|nr:sugar ABC transporter ATP-binding protein [Bifidobacteriaceae bacterium]
MIELTSISKRFGGVQALSDITLTVRQGTIHAFVGENGAGKSTLGKIISGTHAPNSGTMKVDGQVVRFHSPRDAIDHGISTIQQEIALVPKRSVLENVFLGRELTRRGLANKAAMRAEYAELERQTGFGVSPDAIVETLCLADQQKVEMLRAIARHSRLIVFDEPTAALTPNETANLLDVIRQLRDSGVTVIYVSHFLEEVLAIADEITVLRNGQLIKTTPAQDETPASLVTAMLGRSQDSAFPSRPPINGRLGQETLRVDGLSRSGVLHAVSFAARAGEIIGLAGLVGSGRSELLRAIYGADPADAGTVSLLGRPPRTMSPARSIAMGLAMIPESRKDQGLFLRRSVGENMTIGALRGVSRGGLVATRRVSQLVGRFTQELGIKPADPSMEVGLLSGGNQQKVLLAKGLAASPKVLLIDEPTRGVDVGAKYSIYESLFRLAEAGLTLVVVSSEVEEILGIADRVLVMRRGWLVLDAPISEVDQDTIMHAAFGSEAAAPSQLELGPSLEEVLV